MPPPRYPSDLSDEEWAILEPLLSSTEKRGRPPKWPLRHLADAVFYLLRSGCSWRMLPHEYPPWQTVYSHFRKWRIDGRLRRVHDRLREAVRQAEGRDRDPSAAVIDRQVVKTTPVGGPERGYDAFGEWLERWIDSLPGTVAENTRGFYEHRVRTYLKPALGNVKLSELTAEHLDGLYRDLARGKGTPSGRALAPSTVGQVHSTARVALGRAAKKGVIPHNVARDADPPRVEKKERPTLDLGRLEQF